MTKHEQVTSIRALNDSELDGVSGGTMTVHTDPELKAALVAGMVVQTIYDTIAKTTVCTGP